MARPRGNFTNWQKGVLATDGFIKEEVDAWDDARNTDGTPHFINFYSETFTDMRRARRQWKRDRIDEGWTKEQMENELYDYFKASKGKSPWDFLKGSYKPPRKLKDFSDASRRRATSRRRKALQRIRRHVG